MATRLYPLTKIANKHLLPVYDKPVIYYPLNTLVKAGIKDVMIVTGGPHCGAFLSVLKNGKEFGLNSLQFAYQSEAGGIAEALALTERFADGDNVTVILGDNTTDGDISDDVKNFKYGATVFLKEVPDPQRYGVPVFDKKHSITKIEEKPSRPKSNYAVVGLYIYDNKVYNFIKEIKPSKRGELEITDVNNLYIKHNLLTGSFLDGYWSDVGTFESLYAANKYWAEKNENV